MKDLNSIMGLAGFEPTTSSSAGYREAKLPYDPSLASREKLLADFETFCRIDLKLAKRSVWNHVHEIKRFLEACNKDIRQITRHDIRSYLERYSDKSAYTYANVLKSLKVFFRDFLGMPSLVETFRWPKKPVKPKRVCTREELKRFYSALPDIRAKAIFLMYATTGLRKSELLQLRKEDVDLDMRMVKPNVHEGRTKRAWVTFFNEEAERALREYLASRKDNDPRLFYISDRAFRAIWHIGREKTGIAITPQRLREWFSCEMARLGVPDRYVDAFCGRVPQSVLARHYTDYSPEVLKQVYDRAGLKVLG